MYFTIIYIFIKRKRICKIKACSRDNINTFGIKHGFKKIYAQSYNNTQ